MPLKKTKPGSLYILLLFLPVLIMSGFNLDDNTQNEISFPTEIADYPYKINSSPVFYRADSLKYAMNYPAALAIFEGLDKSQLKDDDAIYCLNQIIYINLCMYRYKQAEKLITAFEKEFPEVMINSGQPEYGDYAFNKGIISAFYKGEIDKAVVFLTSAGIIYRATYRNPHLKIAEVWNKLGVIYADYDPDLGKATNAIKAADSIYSGTGQLRRYSAENKFMLTIIGATNRVYIPEQCAEAYKIVMNNPDYVDTLMAARCLSRQGIILKKNAELEKTDTVMQQLSFQKSDSLLKTAIKMAENINSPRVQELYKNMALFYLAQQNEPAFNTCLAGMEKRCREQGDWYGFPDRLRACYFYEKAIREKDKALKTSAFTTSKNLYAKVLHEKRFTPNCLTTIKWECFKRLAETYDYLNNFDSSLVILRDAVAYGVIPDSSPRPSFKDLLEGPNEFKHAKNWFIYYAIIGNTLYHQYKDNPEHSFESLKNAFAFYEQADSLFFYSGIKISDDEAILTYQNEVGATDNLYLNSISAAYDLYYQDTKASNKRKYLDAAFRFIERKKSFLLFRDLLPEDGMSRKDLIDSIRNYHCIRNKLRWEKKKDNGVLDEKNAKAIAEYSGKLEKYYTALNQSCPDYFNARINPPIPTVTEIQKALGPNEAMVQYSVNQNNMHVLFISKDTALLVWKPLDALFFTTFNRFVKQLSTAREDRPLPFSAYQNDAVFLYDQLLGGFDPVIGGTKKMIVLPDQMLFNLSFESLIYQKSDGKTYYNADYLLKQVQVVYSASWKIYAYNLGKKLGNQPSVAAFTYGDGQLEDAGKAIGYIQTLGDYRVSVFKREMCTSAIFRQQAGRNDILHLALHAESNPVDRNDNKIRFSNNDLLYGYDVFGIDMHAGLVVLSACKSSVGRIETGEGVYSLSRAFIQNGVPRVVSTLWSVESATTSTLITYFYQELATNKDVATALHSAKLNYLKNERPELSRPPFWAGLICLQ